MSKSAGYVSADYLRHVAQRARAIKTRSYELMQLREARQVLDVGCGPGIDTIAMASLIDQSGKVTGVDIDEDMLREANAAAQAAHVAQRVQHLQEDIRSLSFADNTFDAVRAERLLQVLPTQYLPSRIIAEMFRVLKPDGRLVVIDTDWASASVDYHDAQLERRLMSFFALHMRPNGLAGRQLYGLFQECGLADIQIEITPLITADYSQTPFGDWLRREAIQANIATEHEMNAWQQYLQERQNQGRFFSHVNIITACGKKSAA